MRKRVNGGSRGHDREQADPRGDRPADLFIDAVALERDGETPAELKLGTFKLAGLDVTALIDKPFKPFGSFSPADEKYRDVTLLAVE